MRSSSGAGRRIAFLHPDLGIGGSERLIIDAAEALRDAGHRVTIFTAHHDREHCFAATRDGSLDVQVRGDFLPGSLRGRLRAPSAIARMSWLTAAALRPPAAFDLVFCDLVAHVVPLARLLTGAPVIFYCHYPDCELMPERSPLYRLYRAPIDRLEEIGTGMATAVLVNSSFTASVFARAFPRLQRRPEVLSPGVELSVAKPIGDTHHLVAIGRYSPEKNHELAIGALARLVAILPADDAAALKLTIAGGYDERLPECRAIFAGLEQMARDLGVGDKVRLLRSPSDGEMADLRAAAGCVLHTAPAEHFGYVPLEAMAAARPVVAANHGGPAETVVDGVTGFLCEPTADAFANALARIVSNPALAARLGNAGRERIASLFSTEAFGARLVGLVDELTAASSLVAGRRAG